jgi:hypothetical protein
MVQMPSKHNLQLPYFDLLPKIHKTPWKTHPVVSAASPMIEPSMSKWIGVQIKTVVRLCLAYPKDSWQLLCKLLNLSSLPPNDVCFTANAV